MSFRNFKLEDISAKLHLNVSQERLFKKISPIIPSDLFIRWRRMTRDVPLHMERAVSETLIFPMLLDLKIQNENYFAIHSGENLDVDKKRDLSGRCDYILDRNINIPSATSVFHSPFLVLLDTKDVNKSVPHCIAQMQALKIYNEKTGNPLSFIFGCVTDADQWQFIKIINDNVYIDSEKFYLVNISLIFGAFQQILDFYKQMFN